MVIDPELSDHVRVTVIATGFGDRAERGVSIPSASAQSPKLDPLAYEKKLEIPTFARKQKEQGTDTLKLKKISVLSGSEDEEKYEIPTFLRRQAD